MRWVDGDAMISRGQTDLGICHTIAGREHRFVHVEQPSLRTPHRHTYVKNDGILSTIRALPAVTARAIRKPLPDVTPGPRTSSAGAALER